MPFTEEKKPFISTDEFNLELEGQITIYMPSYPEVTDQDIDAQLFSYISNAPKGSKLVSLGDLDDAWVKETFPDIQTMDNLRATIKTRLEQENSFRYKSLKYALVSDVLVKCLQGEIPQEVIEVERAGIREQNKMKIHAGGESLYQYLKSEGISEEEYEQRIEEEAKYQIALTIALTKYVKAQALVVEEDEITAYLSADDPDSFMQTLRENGKIEEARQAAARVKAMRQLIDKANIAIIDN